MTLRVNILVFKALIYPRARWICFSSVKLIYDRVTALILVNVSYTLKYKLVEMRNGDE